MAKNIHNKRPNKDTCINLIIDEIGKGIGYTDCLRYFEVVWGNLPESTFLNYWNEAKRIHLERQERINEAKMNATIEMEVEAVKRNILDKFEALEILTEIAKEKRYTDSGSSNDSDRINAIKTINQMQGYNAPKEQKIEVETDQIDLSKLDLDTLLKIKESQNDNNK